MMFIGISLLKQELWEKRQCSNFVSRDSICPGDNRRVRLLQEGRQSPFFGSKNQKSLQTCPVLVCTTGCVLHEDPYWPFCSKTINFEGDGDDNSG